MPASETLPKNRTVSKSAIEFQLAAIQSLINWTEQEVNYEDSFLSLARENTKLAIQFFTDLLL